MSGSEDESSVVGRQRRIWAICRILGVPDADRYCVRKGDVVRLIRGAEGSDAPTQDRFVEALDREFPGPHRTPVPVIYLAMTMRDVGAKAEHLRAVRAVQDAVRRGIDGLPTVTLPATERQ